jgi:hypothetical protein
MFRRTLSLALIFGLCGISAPAQTAPSGVIVQASAARINSSEAAAGTTVFDGDRLEASANGVLGVRSGTASFLLSQGSVLWMNHDGPVPTPRLQSGTVSFRLDAEGALGIVSGDVTVSATKPGTAGQVTVEQCAVVVTATAQSVQVTAGKEQKIIDAGQSYRVVGEGCGTSQKSKLPAAIHGRFMLLPASVIVITVIAVQEALESPDRP